MTEGDRIDVLDEGFVRLDGVLADDLSVANAARVSFGVRRERMEPSDEGLIRFLMRERHGSPFEHNSFRFHIRCPIFVAREWFRHRVGCLEAGAEVSIVGDTGRAPRSKRRTMLELHDAWHLGEADGHVQPRARLRTMRLRVLDEATGEFTTGRIANIVASGIKPLYDVYLADGKRLAMTADHRVLTDVGWHALRDAVGLVGDRQDARPTRSCALVVNGVPVRIHDPHGIAVRRVGFKLRGHGVQVVNVVYRGDEETYDLTMEGPHHNFVANGVVVHNSFNELSGRYTEIPDAFYLPAAEDVRTQVGKPGAYTFEQLDDDTAERTRERMRESYAAAYAAYRAMLADGVAKEVARSVLPVGIYTEFYWTLNARSLMNFLSLRNAETAQREIRRYAEAVEQHFARHMPVTHAAFVARERVAP